MPANLDHLNALELQQQGTALRALGRSLLAGEGEDLAQDGWLAAMQARSPRHLGGWLVGTVRRLAASHRRRDARRQKRELAAARPEALPSAADAAAAAEVARRIAAAVEGLHEPYRTAVVLRFWHGLEPQQLGERLGVPANTARSRVQRGLELLRVQLSRECGSRAAWAGPLTVMIESSAATAVAASTASLAPVLFAMKTRMLLGVAVLALLACGLLLPDGQQQNATTTDTAAGTAITAPVAKGTDAAAAAAGGDRMLAPDPDQASVRVRVVDEHDLPVADILVDAFRSDGQRRPRINATTDHGGIAALALPSGEYFVTADAASPKLRPDLFSSTEKVQVAADTIEVRLTMERYSCSVQVSVVDDLGSPLAGARISRPEQTAGPTPTELTTGVSGTVLFQGLPPGTRRFELGALGQLAVARPKDPHQSCVVARDGFARLEYRLPRKANVRFLLQGQEGVEARFELRCSEDRWQFISGMLNTMGGEARVRLPPGKFTVTTPFVGAASPVLVRGEIPFEVRAGEQQDVLIPLERAPGSLSLTILDEHGRPFDRAHLCVRSVLPRSWMKVVPNSTAEGGRYVVMGIPEEPLILQIDTRVPDRNVAFFGGSDDKPYLELPGPMSGLIVVVHDAYIIRGTVVDAQDQPLSGSVRRGSAGGSFYDVVEIGRDQRGVPIEPGRFEFRCLRPGKYPLWIGNHEEGPPDAMVEVGPRVTPSHTAEVVLRQRPAAGTK